MLVRNLTYVFISIILLLSAIQAVGFKGGNLCSMVGVVKVTWLHPYSGHELSTESQ